MRRRSRILLVVAVVVAGAAAAGWWWWHRPPWGDANEVVEDADRAEAYLTHGYASGEPPIERLSGPVSLDDASLRELKGLLGDGANFHMNLNKCDPLVEYEIVLHAGEREAHVYLSGTCRETAVVLGGRPVSGWEDSGDISRRLRAIMTRLFPPA